MKLTLYLHCITLALFCQGFFVSAPVSALSYDLETFDADYYLTRDADGKSHLKVVETIVADFPTDDSYHGLTRIIPFTNQNGKNLTMPSDQELNITVTHNGITEQPFDITSEDGYFAVKLGDPDRYVHGEHVYTLTYEFINVITAPNANGQELYWDATGNDWQRGFDQVTARVHITDDQLRQNLTGRTACYVGSYGGRGSERCLIQETADGYEFSTSQISRSEGLTFVIGFATDTFAVPAPIRDFRLVIMSLVAGIIALGIIVYIFYVRRRSAVKRRYYQGLFIKPEYSAPRELSVAEMTTNYLHNTFITPSQTYIASLIEMAVQNKVELINEKKSNHAKSQTWKIRLTTTDFSAPELDVLKIFTKNSFTPEVGMTLKLRADGSHATALTYAHNFATAVTAALTEKGLSEPKPPHAKPNPATILGTIAAIWIFAGITAGIILLSDIPSYVEIVGGWGLLAADIAVWLGIFIASTVVSVKDAPLFTHTEKGLDYSRYLDGLKQYIKLAEADRIKFLQSVDGVDTSPQGIVKLYEKLLPYAIVLGLEKSWTAEMQKYYEIEDVAAPSWYHNDLGTAFIASEFARSFHDFDNSVSTVALHSTSSSSSSSGSGFGGGGFSGGGGGGGGGGAW